MASASASVCASTGASPAAAAIGVATGHSAPQQANLGLVANETTTVSGGAGPQLLRSGTDE
ncbi:hypothetical protein E2562_003444 [Oryza meyeriana var. granulata]|uniref:Uncharacterized protein n=1 Tax=Oryza meyeriana var. granulata TaxID=110450 RepID=A0A6G1EDQ1_9ORYZ|nr:hypothetical protein E2562_003444 [Oryza meyeriana var. granulata]